MSLMRDNEVITEGFALAEKNFGLDIGGLKGMSTRSKSLPMQSKVTEILRDLLSIHEEMEASLDGLNVSGKLFVTSISHET